MRMRPWVVRQIKDPNVRTFWRTEFAGYDKRFLSENIAPVQNKVGQLLMAPPIRNIVGQVRSKIDFRFMMDDQRIFIANLAKGRLGEDKANLLGALLVAQFQLAAMGRADVPEAIRAKVIDMRSIPASHLRDRVNVYATSVTQDAQIQDAVLPQLHCVRTMTEGDLLFLFIPHVLSLMNSPPE